MLRVLLIDDSPIFTDAVSRALNAFDGVTVVAACDGGAEGVRVAGRNEVDLALVDLRMPGSDGARTARLLRAARPDLFIVMVSLSPSDVMWEAVSRDDAQHAVQKEDLFEHLPSLLGECRQRLGRLS